MYIASQIVVLLIFYAPFLIGKRCFYYTDTTFFLEPQARFLSEALLSKRIPLWNVFNYCGMPQLAVTFPSLFYPPDWLLVLLPFDSGLALSMIFHISLAAAGTFVLLQTFGFTRLPALAASIIFSLSGYMFALTSNHSLVAGASWIPLSLWLLRRLESSEAGKFWTMFWCSIAILMLLLSGRPEMSMPGIALLVIYVFISAYGRFRSSNQTIQSQAQSQAQDHNLIQPPRPLLDQAFVWQCRALFLAFTFSLPAILPVAEWLSLSRRATGLQLPEVFLYSATWYDVVSMFLGPSLGDLRVHGADFRPLVMFANLPPYVSCAYVGPVAATLALWGALDRTWRWRWIIAALLGLTILASLGNSTPLIPVAISYFPALAFVRFPIKLLVFAIFFIALLSARGLDCCTGKRASILGSVLFWVLIAVCGSTLIWFGNSGHTLGFSNALAYIGKELKAEILIGNSAVLASIIGLGLSAIAYLAKTGRISTQRACIIIVISLIGTIMVNAFKMEHGGAKADYWKPPSFTAENIRALQSAEGVDKKSRVINLCIERFTVPDSYLMNAHDRLEVGDYQYMRQILKPNTNSDFSIPETLGFEGTNRGDYGMVGLHCYLESSQSSRPEVVTPTDAPLSRFCALTSTSYAITQKYRTIGKRVPVSLLNKALFRLDFEDEAMNVRIYKALNYQPRCYVSHQWHWAKSHNEVLDSIVSSAPNDFNPALVTMLEKPDSLSMSQELDPPASPDLSQDQISILNDAPELIKIKVITKSDSFLVLADQDYPGWEAYLDSKSVQIYTANAFNRAIYIPAGEHFVEFKYAPGSLKLGLVLFGLGVLLAVYFAFIDAKTSKKQTA